MNKKKFIIISLIFTAIYCPIMFLYILANNTSLETTYKAESERISHYNYELVTTLVRNDLLMNNLRGARIKLDELMHDGLYSSYSILLGSQPKDLPGQSEYFVPVYFGVDGKGELWGGIQFKSNMSNPSNGLADFFKKSGQSLIFTALLSGLFMLIIFLTLFISTSKMEQTIREILTHPGQKTPIPGGIWENLLLKIQNLAIERHQFEQEALEGIVAKAIARMTQMLAHDVRKPFSMLKSGLSVLQHTNDPREFKGKLAFLTSEVARATKSVDGMIADVMEIGSSSTELMKEPVAPESLIESTLLDIFRMYPKSDVLVKYDFGHQSMVDVHPQKMGRVLSNIVGNAVQAISFKGHIWFKTVEANDHIEFVIGNSGSHIAQENLTKLFEAFFTSGKKGGTGLGLAIAKKVVEAHGGKIWCESVRNTQFPEGMVEFHFTLPTTSGIGASYSGNLPTSSKEVIDQYREMQKGSVEAPFKKEASEVLLENELLAMKVPLSILVVDDESLYINTIKSMILQGDPIKNTLTISEANDPDAALNLMKAQSYDLVISDVDMGHSELSGFELVAKLRREMDFKGIICVHSNRMVSDDYKKAMAMGADSFLPKPMAREHLLKLLLQAASLKANLASPKDAGREKSVKPEMAIVEDDPFIREHWVKSMGTQVKVHHYASPEALAMELERDTTLIQRLSLIVTDYYFDTSPETGMEVGSRVKSLRKGIPVLLSSNGDFKVEKFSGNIDRVISKDPPAKFEDLLT